MLKSDDTILRRLAICLMARLYLLNKQVIPIISRFLESQDKGEFATAVRGFEGMRLRADIALPILLKHLDPNRPYKGYRENIMRSFRRLMKHADLKTLKNPEVVEKLIRVLRSERWDYRWNAMLCLGYLDKFAEPAIPHLEEMNGTGMERYWIEQIIKKIKGEKHDYIPEDR
jgi:hypothetical protein